MSITHHPEDATLMGFAAGTLTEPFGIVVAAHLEMCDVCRRTYRTMAHLGAVTMQTAAPSDLDTGALDRILTQLDSTDALDSRRQKPVPPLPKSAAGLPQVLARVLGGDFSTIKWRNVIGGAQDRRIMFKSRSGVHSLRLLRAQPGASLPEHAHVGTELTLVLQGRLRDGGKFYGPGDVTDMDDEGTHNPIVDGDETCICIIANEAPPLFKQLKMRVLQKLIGI